ncbi:MAG: hypothetical protein J3R72DRAFT_107424 [Linnemannia gamsii]|nr:MAG: hypothetical protein J3R72DRAFT_107424 [Linnemannia gamsii]
MFLLPSLCIAFTLFCAYTQQTAIMHIVPHPFLHTSFSRLFLFVMPSIENERRRKPTIISSQYLCCLSMFLFL